MSQSCYQQTLACWTKCSDSLKELDFPSVGRHSSVAPPTRTDTPPVSSPLGQRNTQARGRGGLLT